VRLCDFRLHRREKSRYALGGSREVLRKSGRSSQRKVAKVQRRKGEPPPSKGPMHLDRRLHDNLADLVLGHSTPPRALAPWRLCVESENLLRPLVSARPNRAALFGFGSAGLGIAALLLDHRTQDGSLLEDTLVDASCHEDVIYQGSTWFLFHCTDPRRAWLASRIDPVDALYNEKPAADQGTALLQLVVLPDSKQYQHRPTRINDINH
jgi:hypothetical protein